MVCHGLPAFELERNALTTWCQLLPVSSSHFQPICAPCWRMCLSSCSKLKPKMPGSVKIRQDPSSFFRFFALWTFWTWVPKAHAIDEHEIAVHHDPCFSTWLPASTDANAGGSFVVLTGWKWQKRTASPWKARCIQMGADVGSPFTLELLHASIWICKHPKI